MRALLYIRVSTQEQTENYSIGAQQERLEAYCKAKGWLVHDIYVDGGYSGSNTDRPALQRMLLDLEKADVVVVYRLDRLSRSQRDTLTLIEDHFLARKVDFVSITETLDTSTPFGKAMIGILSVFAQLERETISERMRMGQIKRAEDGFAAMGGDYDPAGYARHEGELILKPEEAEHIQVAFNLYEQYLSITKVQKQLRKMEYDVWRFRRYRDILSNPLYCGFVTFAGETYPGRHEAIISEEQFNRVQVLLNRHKGKNSHKAKESLLSGIITCGLCGEQFHSYHTSKQPRHLKVYRYYICRAKRFPAEYKSGKCLNKTWRQDALEKIIVAELQQIQLKKEPIEENEKQRPDFDRLIKNIDVKIDRLVSLYADGAIDKNILDKQVKRLVSDKKQLVGEKKDFDSQPQLIESDLDRYIISLESGDFGVRQAVIKKLIQRIVVNKETIKIEWAF